MHSLLSLGRTFTIYLDIVYQQDFMGLLLFGNIFMHNLCVLSINWAYYVIMQLSQYSIFLVCKRVQTWNIFCCNLFLSAPRECVYPNAEFVVFFCCCLYWCPSQEEFFDTIHYLRAWISSFLIFILRETRIWCCHRGVWFLFCMFVLRHFSHSFHFSLMFFFMSFCTLGSNVFC